MAEEAGSVMEIAITKAKRVLAVDTKTIPTEMFVEAVYRGLADILNSGMSKITVKDLEGEELEAAKHAAFVKAEANLKALMAGEIKTKSAPGKKAVKVPTEIKTEALRLAKAAITQQIKDGGEKVSLYAKSDITKWAKELLEVDDSYFTLATETLERRKATPIKISLANLKPSEKLVRAAEEKKSKAKAAKPALSAKQAGMPAPRQKKPAAPTHTAH
jgi:hypothetical protein